MAMIRRGYFLLVSAISLQWVVWACISLARHLVAPGQGVSGQADPSTLALQIAIIVVTAPIFAFHWMQAQRLAQTGAEERGAVARRVYLYGILAVTIAPLASNVYDIVTEAFRWVLRAAYGVVVAPLDTGASSAADSMAEVVVTAVDMRQSAVAIVILGVLAAYHLRVAAADRRAVPETGTAALVRRLYVLVGSAAGLAAMAGGAGEVLRRVMPDFRTLTVPTPVDGALAEWAAQALVGAGVWALFWAWWQRLFRDGGDAERASALRKLFLFAVVAIGALTTVANAAGILAGVLRAALGLEPQGELRDALAPLVVAAVVWAYHSRVLQADAAVAAEAPRQAAIRRAYHYLMAGIGHVLTVAGAAGVMSALLRTAAAAVVIEIAVKEQLAWFTAILVVGLPLWVMPWLRAQAAALADGAVGEGERRSTIRRLYLYLVLLATGIAVVGGAIYMVYRIVSRLLGSSGAGENLGLDLAQAVSFIAIAGTSWAYHFRILRADGRLDTQAETARLEGRRVVVLDAGDGVGSGDAVPASLATVVADALRRDLPALGVDVLPIAAGTGGALEAIRSADVVLLPWTALLAADDLDRALAASPALKLLLPTRREGWAWVGVDAWEPDALAAQAVHAVRRWAAGEQVRPDRPLGVGALLAIGLGVALLFIALGMPIIGMVMAE